jgi:hypothetical protein
VDAKVSPDKETDAGATLAKERSQVSGKQRPGRREKTEKF